VRGLLGTLFLALSFFLLALFASFAPFARRREDLIRSFPRLLALFASFGLFALFAPFAPPLHAEGSPLPGGSREELQKERERLYREWLELAREEMEVRSELLRLGLALERSRRELEEARRREEEARRRLGEAERKRLFWEERLRESREKAGAWLRFLYEEGEVGYLDVVLGATDFADFLSRYELLGTLTARGLERLEEARRFHLLAREEERREREARQEAERWRVEREKAHGELLALESRKKEVLRRLETLGAEKRASLYDLDRRWGEMLPELRAFLAGFSRLPWEKLAPDLVRPDYQELKLTAEIGEETINRFLSTQGSFKASFRVRFLPGEVRVSDGEGLFEMRAAPFPEGRRSLALRPFAFHFLGVPATPDLLRELEEEFTLSVSLPPVIEPLRLLGVRLEEGKLVLTLGP